MKMFGSIIRALHQPADPSLLAGFRICFGICMMVDIPQERGMSRADQTYGDEADAYCTFPLVHGMKPFSQDIMILLYTVMFLNAFFITIGFLCRLNTVVFAIIYWYFFIIDKSSWNNHSYLYGLIAILLSVTNADHYMSADGIIRKSKSNKDVPKWNYDLFRFQVFIVYFFAGIKKTESDWLTGYSMNKLSREWVFDPLRIFLSNDDIDFWVVHICGFVYDISVGFLLYFDKTRSLGLLLCASFHGLNSRMFSIGMFPYVMMAASFIFCDPKSVKNVAGKMFGKSCLRPAEQNPACVYEKSKKVANMRPNRKQVAAFLFTVLYISLQIFLPFSHSITKGYNGWTKGLYGYSWDMMVHSFSNQHVKISYTNLDTGEVGFLKAGAFLSGKRSRWTNQPEMAYQYAKCIWHQLKKFGIENSAVYFDIWKSMNGRFQQRIFDPNVDLANYPWTPFAKPTFVMPLLSDLTSWREKLKEIKRNLRNSSMEYNIVFVADFPEMHLENFVHKDFGNTTIEVLHGEVIVETQNVNVSVKTGNRQKVTPGVFHRVYTVSNHPSCYCYTYVNTTVQILRRQLDEYRKWINMSPDNKGYGYSQPSAEFNPEITELYQREQKYRELKRTLTTWRNFQSFTIRKIALFRRSFLLAVFSLRNLAIGKPTSMEQLQNEIAFLNSWSVTSDQKNARRDMPVDDDTKQKSYKDDSKTEL